ncbi:NfeD-like C-terminal%2C partner-binding [uncultured Roseburia sp.]|uniref:NfeD family protein n=1 Tax=Brotonthovivens ammoniilytica TaxID=2981725 RepID=A0ABT2TI79_9FIRM|nr:NfeD family protein [Brotonthovivens ammoniilytica]MCU6761908.1 NfeD family protein [Brotonthovivens ammoniilytica]SCI50323.1 NfeD-like C-terminal%2C partner-binding [uncultured Roseburia sp.]
MIAIGWLIILVILVVAEIATLGLTTIWFAGGALAAFIACVAGAGMPVQIILFFVVSCVLLFFTRPIAKKHFNQDRIKTNAESLIGEQAVVLEEIDNLNAAGQVRIQGQEWTARASDGSVKIPKDTVVTVLAIEGVKLIVKEAE